MSEHENEQAVCEECGKNEAVCTMALMMGSKVLHRKLCQACMAKTSMAIAAGNLGQVLGSILANTRRAAQPDEAQETAEAPKPPKSPQPAKTPAPSALPEVAGEPAVCPGCGMTYATLRARGRAGCAACWPAYMGTLAAVNPTLQHVGRRPVSGEAAQRNRARREELQRRLDEAIAREDYEMAAQLRDTLRSADQQGGQHDA